MFGCSELRSRLTWVLRSMSPRRVQSASTGFVNFVVSGSRWMMNQRQLSCMLLLRLASTIATQSNSLQGRRRRLPTSCNECSMLPPVWSVTHESSIAVWRHYSTTSFIGWMCQRGLVTRWVSWCTAVFTVRHLGTSPTISSHPPTSLLGFVCFPQTDTSSSYLAVDSTHTAVGRFRLLVRRSGIRCLTNSEIRRVVLTVLSSFLRQSCLVFTNVTSALEVFNVMRYINPRFTYLLTYLSPWVDRDRRLCE